MEAQGPDFVFNAAQAARDNLKVSPSNPGVRCEEKVNIRATGTGPIARCASFCAGKLSFRN